jgi:hypothetical protein
VTSYFSYIGDLDDPDFHWDDPARAPSAGNLPRRIVPAAFGSVDVDRLVLREQIETGIREGKRLDWGAWGVKMTGQELAQYFGPDHVYAAEIAALEPERSYVLVCAEQ